MLEIAAFLLLTGGGDTDSTPSASTGVPRRSLAAWEDEAPQEVPIPRHDSPSLRLLAELDPLPSFSQAPDGGKDRGVSFGVAAHGRYSIPFGAAERNSVVYAGVVLVQQYVSWADLFDPGWGFDIEVDVYFGGPKSPAKGEAGSRFGVVGIFERDTFGGDHIGSSLGGSVQVGDLSMEELLVGGVAYQGLGPGVYTKGHVAVGAVHYSEVHATFSGLGILQTRDELLADTWTISSDFRAEIGLLAGPIGFSFGIGLRIQAPPSEGPRVSLNSGAFWSFDLTLGVDIAF
jgi:hypothetical protein